MSDQPQREKLLIVDDNRNMCALISQFLGGFGYQIEVENDSRNVLERLRQQEFDLVLIDVVMPHVGGLELLGKIKAEFSSLPVMVMTSFASIPTARGALQAGADDFVTKPVKGEFWDLRIRKILDRE